MSPAAPAAGEVREAAAEWGRPDLPGALSAWLESSARVVYLTDGRTRQIQVGNGTVVLRKAALRQMATAGRVSGTVIQALRWLGRRHIDTSLVRTLRRRLSPADRQQLLRDVRFAPAWIANIMKRVAEDKP